MTSDAHFSRSRVPSDEAASRAARRRDVWRGALAGGLAALLMLAVIIVLRTATGVSSVLDALAAVILAWMPLGLFSALLDFFGTAAKAWLLVGILAALTAAGAIFGRAFARNTAGSRRVKWGRGLTFAVAAYVALALFLVWALDIRTGGVLAGGRLLWALCYLAVALLVFGLAMPLALALMRRTQPPPSTDGPPADLSRRRFLTGAGLGLATAAALAVLGREVARVRNAEAVDFAGGGTLPSPITPNGKFYLVSKNFVDPRVDTSETDWTIRIDGLVERPQTLTAADLRALAGPDFVSTLTCISNPIGGPLISTARWTGAPLAVVLRRAGVEPGVVDVVFHARDGYSDSIPLAKALAPTTALVWGMNGVPLPAKHGFPVRVIVPGRYGIKNVKWLERISLVNTDYQGYWQQQGWTDVGIVKTESQISVPANKAIVRAGAAELAGIAFAGDRGIRQVEVSLDGGATWQTCQITADPSGHSLSWVLWRYPWHPAPGTYTLLVRATDGTGALQTSTHAPTLPDGASGWQRIVVGVAG